MDVVQEQLGHASIKTTTICARVTEEDKVRAVDALAKVRVPHSTPDAWAKPSHLLRPQATLLQVADALAKASRSSNENRETGASRARRTQMVRASGENLSSPRHFRHPSCLAPTPPLAQAGRGPCPHHRRPFALGPVPSTHRLPHARYTAYPSRPLPQDPCPPSWTAIQSPEFSGERSISTGFTRRGRRPDRGSVLRGARRIRAYWPDAITSRSRECDRMPPH